MKRFVTLLGLVFFTFLVYLPVGYCEQAKISVTGNSQLDLIPDQAVVTFSSVATGKTAEEARQTNNLAITQTLLALQDLKIPRNQIQTSQYIIYPIVEDQSKSGKAPAIIGYRATTTLTVTTNQLNQTGLIIDKAFQAGVNQVDRVVFERQALGEVKTQLLKNAVLDAMTKAQAMASAVGKHVGKIVSLSENHVSIQTSDNNRYFLKSSASAETSLSPGNVKASSSVSLVIELE